MPKRSLHILPALLLAAGLLPAGLAAPALAAGQAPFTPDQAQAGKQVYDQQCSACHGRKLQGKAGPALAGPDFAGSLQYGNWSAQQLYGFIAKHMPKNDPGSLSRQQYVEVFAYILSKNGFASGKTPLDAKSVGSIDLLPLPAQAGKSGGKSGSESGGKSGG